MFNKEKCLENIYAIAKAKSIKVSTLEKNAKVSAGYIARLAKYDNDSSPAINTLLSFADTLGVSLYELLDKNNSRLTNKERMVLDFIKKIYHLTEKQEITWEIEEMEQIIEHDPVTGYPTYYPPNRYEFKSKIISSEYVSPYDEDAEAYNTYRDRHSYVCYKSTLPNEMPVCMIPVSTSSGKSIELYAIESDKLSPICSSNYSAEDIRNAIEELYEAVAGHSSIELSKILENKINSFLKEKNNS